MAEYRNYITNIPHLERPVIHDSCNVLYPYVFGCRRTTWYWKFQNVQNMFELYLFRIKSLYVYTMYWLAIYGIFLGHSTMFMWPAGDRELLN